MQNRIYMILVGVMIMTINHHPVFATTKIVIAHRGASGYLPEHTLPAKAMAYAQGADYLEQDLVLTKDNELIVLHDHYLDRVTDVDKQFPGRARADKRYYAIDFTLEEIRKLNITEGFEVKSGKKIQTFPNRFPMWKANFKIHTFAEEIEFIQGLNYSTNKNVGLYPEIKSPWFHQQEGKDISSLVLQTLKKYGYASKKSQIYLQCFDPNELKRIKFELLPKLGMELKIIQLIAYTDWEETFAKTTDGKLENYSYDWMFQPGSMQKIALYADGIGPSYAMLINVTKQPNQVTFTNLLKEAKTANLVIHPFTIRADQLPSYVNNINQLFSLLYQQADVDGLFTDFPDQAVSYLQIHSQR